MYTADLESALHYLLRVELAAHTTLQGEELKVFKDFVTLVAKVTSSLIIKLSVVKRLTESQDFYKLETFYGVNVTKSPDFMHVDWNTCLLILSHKLTLWRPRPLQAIKQTPFYK